MSGTHEHFVMFSTNGQLCCLAEAGEALLHLDWQVKARTA